MAEGTQATNSALAPLALTDLLQEDISRDPRETLQAVLQDLGQASWAMEHVRKFLESPRVQKTEAGSEADFWATVLSQLLGGIDTSLRWFGEDFAPALREDEEQEEKH